MGGTNGLRDTVAVNTLEVHTYTCTYTPFGGNRVHACCRLLCLALTEILPYPIHTCACLHPFGLVCMYWVDGVVGGAVTCNGTYASLWKQGNKEVRFVIQSATALRPQGLHS